MAASECYRDKFAVCPVEVCESSVAWKSFKFAIPNPNRYGDAATGAWVGLVLK